MHRGFIDKNRRLFNLRQMQVKNVLPEHFAQYYPKFISLLEKYYEWQQERSSTELINHLFAVRDINETDITLLSYIEDELLLGDAYFEGFGNTDVQKRAAANFSNVLFRSKGTKFAIEWFFRSFYGVDAEVLYPKENVFKVSDANSTLGPDSLRYLTDDKLYQTFALLIKVGIPVSKWKDVFKLFAHPAGMYLGGEVLLSDIRNVVTSFPIDNATVTTKTDPVYTLTPAASSVDEGQSLGFTVTGTNVTDNIDGVYYYIENASTSNNDFSVFYDSSNPGYVSINDVLGTAQGTFSINTKVDSDESETTEQFKVYIKDRNNNIQDSATISLNDTPLTFSLLVDSARAIVNESTGQSGTSTIVQVFDEGDVIPFRIVNGASNPPNLSVQYYVEPIGINQIDSSDFITSPPLVGSPATIQLVDDSARFTLQTKIEKSNAIEPDAYFRVMLKYGSNIKDSSDSIRIDNVIPIFNVTFDSSSVFEGQSLDATLTIDQYNIGTRINWALSGDITSDPRVSQASGTFIADDVNTPFSIPFLQTDSAAVGGSVSGTLQISPVGFTPDPYTQANFSLLDSDPVYDIIATPAAAAEGDSATFTAIGTNVPNGTTIYLYVDYNETDVNDFVSTPPLTGSRQAITFTDNVGSPDVTLQFATNGDASNETFTVNLSSTSGGAADLRSQDFLITAVPYTLTSDVTAVDEGETVTFTFGGADGEYFYTLVGTNITSQDFSGGLTGSFTVSGGTGQFTATLINDVKTEGTETFVAEVSETSGGLPVKSSASITVSDTSKPTYSVTANNITEGQEFVANITAAISGTETVYVEITGSAASKFVTTQIATTASSSFNVSFGLTTFSDTFEGNPSGTVSVYRGSYGGTLLASTTFTVNDAAASAGLTVNDTTPDEGDTITFTITNPSNLPSTIYYSILNDVVTVRTDATASSGTNYIPLASTSGLTTGMESTASGVNGTITSVQSGGVYMSTNLTSTISSGTNIYFAQPAVFDDFTGNPYGSTTGSTFNVTIASNSDFTNDTYTFVIRDAEYGGNNLATVAITIQDQTTGLVDLSTTTTTISDISFNTSSYATIQFLSDGTIKASGSENPGGNGVIIGTWTTGSFTPSDYTIIATINNRSGGDIDGSYGTTLTLDTIRTFSLISYTPPTTGKRSASMDVTFVVTGPGSGNSDSTTVFFLTEANTTQGDVEEK